ncbi:MAG TPA: inorganic phosphate transporter [Chthoniobacterales bacterium]|nr:inorganic phosphate transporter [Chthoniobacterales bacterium]
MIFTFVLLAAAFLAFSNGANDNFKGVATIYGSGTAGYKASITWATITTAAGSVASVFLAQAILKKFSGKGLIPDAFTGSEYFLLAVALGASLTVILATRLGFPVSTTHGILGSMIGCGLVAAGSSGVSFGALGKGFVIPLLLSPVLAVGVGAILYGLFHAIRHTLRIPKEWCVCVGECQQVLAIPHGSSIFAMRAIPMPELFLAEGETLSSCNERYAGNVAGIDAQRLVDLGHFLSAGIVSFARGLNDTPKIAGLLLLVKWLTPVSDIVIVMVAMAVGGLLGARRVAETMSHKITSMNPGQGFTSNLATGILVILASTFGLPVSMTHVSVGALFGIGILTGRANANTVMGIALSWVITLPCAAAIGGLAYYVTHLIHEA